jgi:hypothetical protein
VTPAGALGVNHSRLLISVVVVGDDSKEDDENDYSQKEDGRKNEH